MKIPKMFELPPPRLTVLKFQLRKSDIDPTPNFQRRAVHFREGDHVRLEILNSTYDTPRQIYFLSNFIFFLNLFVKFQENIWRYKKK